MWIHFPVRLKWPLNLWSFQFLQCDWNQTKWTRMSTGQLNTLKNTMKISQGLTNTACHHLLHILTRRNMCQRLSTVDRFCATKKIQKGNFPLFQSLHVANQRLISLQWTPVIILNVPEAMMMMRVIALKQAELLRQFTIMNLMTLPRLSNQKIQHIFPCLAR